MLYGSFSEVPLECPPYSGHPIDVMSSDNRGTGGRKRIYGLEIEIKLIGDGPERAR